MSKAQWAFRPAVLMRAIKAAEKAGKNVVGAEIDSASGKIELRFQKSSASPAETVNEWGWRRMTRIRLEYIHEYRDRHGKLRRYFRRPGFKRIALIGVPGSDEFMTAYQLALAGQPARIEIGAGRTKPGTVNAAAVGYYTSLAFRSLAPGTQKMRRAILERFREAHGDKRIAMLPHEFIVRTIGKRSPFAARNWLKTLRGFLQFCVSEGFRDNDPTQGIKLPRIKSDGVHTWTEAEIAQFQERHALGTRARLALALLLYTAQRRGDVVRMGRQHVRDGMIAVRQQKTGATLQVPIHSELRKALDITPSEHLTFFGHSKRQAIFGRGFRRPPHSALPPSTAAASATTRWT
jgi:hypothetical protein